MRIYSNRDELANVTCMSHLPMNQAIQMLANVQHGEWIPWVEENLPFGIDQAGNYMRVYRNQDKLNSEPVRNLKEAVQMLANVQHGEWIPWVEENLPFGRAQAFNYINIYKKQDKVLENVQRVGHLPMREAIQMLATPKQEAGGGVISTG